MFPHVFFPPLSSYVPPIRSVEIANALLAFQNILVTYSVFSYQNCKISVNDDMPKNPGSPFCTIKDVGVRSEDGSVVGAGRYCTMAKGQIRVRLFVSNRFDQGFEDETLLTSTSADYGIHAISKSIMNALHGSLPTDANNEMIFHGPPTWSHWGVVDREHLNEGWAGLDIFFDVSFKMNFDTHLWLPILD